VTLKSFRTQIKQRVRKEFRRFLKKTVLKRKPPKDVFVLCLPSWEAIEIFEVYDKLGIPRGNITGVEIDSKAFQILKSKELGIRLFKQDVTRNFPEAPNGAYDIINLDFTGHITANVLCLFLRIFGNHWLSSGGVFGVTSMVGREQTRTLETTGWMVGLANYLAQFFHEESPQATDEWAEQFFSHRGFIDVAIIYSALPTLFYGVFIQDYEDDEILHILRNFSRRIGGTWTLTCEETGEKLVCGGIDNVIRYLYPPDEARKMLQGFRADLARVRGAFIGFVEGQMFFKKALRIMYYSGKNPMRCAYYQFVDGIEYFQKFPYHTWADALTHYLHLGTLPPLITIPKPKKPPPSKREVTQAIKNGLAHARGYNT